MDYSEDAVRDAYEEETGQKLPKNWEIYFEIADQKVNSDGLKPDGTKILGACYWIAFLRSTATTSTDGAYASTSTSIGSASESKSLLGHGSEKSNIWEDRYNKLISSEPDHDVYAGVSVPLPPSPYGWRDGATRRHVMRWWK